MWGEHSDSSFSLWQRDSAGLSFLLGWELDHSSSNVLPLPPLGQTQLLEHMT